MKSCIITNGNVWNLYYQHQKCHELVILTSETSESCNARLSGGSNSVSLNDQTSSNWIDDDAFVTLIIRRVACRNAVGLPQCGLPQCNAVFGKVMMYGSSSPGLGFRVRVRSSVKYYLEQEICQVQGKIGMVNRDFAHICHFSSKESVLAIKCNKMKT